MGPISLGLAFAASLGAATSSGMSDYYALGSRFMDIFSCFGGIHIRVYRYCKKVCVTVTLKQSFIIAVIPLGKKCIKVTFEGVGFLLSL